MPAEVQYHVVIDGQSRGPLSLEQIGRRISGGEINAESLVWTEGMENWVAASSIAAMQTLFASKGGSTPPPIPSS